MSVAELTISRDRPDAEDARRLAERLDAELRGLYPGDDIHGLHPEDLRDPRFTLLVARLGKEAVGCGALRAREPGVGEVKRMYVVPEFRGRGVGRALLAALEDAAARLGYATLRVETGTRQPEAIGLYRSAGYEDGPRFAEYADDPFSVCFEKRLAPGPTGGEAGAER